ncbi:hypothetical protein DFH09DRAFT_1068972 [Mycena vulgaris]|nr:hypothetical protein DFH09DRAFT_1068972 [Mycena vulgaris]
MVSSWFQGGAEQGSDQTYTTTKRSSRVGRWKRRVSLTIGDGIGGGRQKRMVKRYVQEFLSTSQPISEQDRGRVAQMIKLLMPANPKQKSKRKVAVKFVPEEADNEDDELELLDAPTNSKPNWDYSGRPDQKAWTRGEPEWHRSCGNEEAEVNRKEVDRSGVGTGKTGNGPEIKSKYKKDVQRLRHNPGVQVEDKD